MTSLTNSDTLFILFLVGIMMVIVIFPHKNEEIDMSKKDLNKIPCHERGKEHKFVPTFQGGDTYQCTVCGWKVDMTED